MGLKLDMVVEKGKRWSGLEVRYGGRRERDGMGLKLDMVVVGKEMEWA